MWDSFKSELEGEDRFDAAGYVKALCANSKIQIRETSFLNMRFLEGWKSLVEELIKSIRVYPIEIESIDDRLNILNVHFFTLKTTREVNVWRAIHKAQMRSLTTCANCGATKQPTRNAQQNAFFCEDCKENAHKINKTGTWLDRY